MSLSELHVPPAATGGIVTIGNFDGVHRGHQDMLKRVRQTAADRSLPAVVVTFDPHPVTVLRPEVRLPRLSTIATRTELLTRFGADAVVVLPVDRDLLNMTPEVFFEDIVRGRLQAAELVEGPDFRFGKDRSGDVDVLRQLCQTGGLKLTVIDAVRSDTELISSTTIRRLIETGCFDRAVELLGHSYTLSGSVGTGAGRGSGIGFPTANLTDVEELIPADGVYAGVCRVNDVRHAAAVSIGPNPTFDDQRRKVECHLLDFDGDLYGRTLAVSLAKKIRNLRSFDDVGQLTQTIRCDVEECRNLLKDRL